MPRRRLAKSFASAALIVAIIFALSPRAKGEDQAYSPKQLSEALSRFQSANKRFARGRTLFAGGDITAAAREFEACTTILPEHIYARFYLANSLYLQKDYARALEAIEEAERGIAFMEALDAYALERNVQTMEDARRILEAENQARTSCRESRKLEQLVRVIEEDKKKLDDGGHETVSSRNGRNSLYAYSHGNILFQLRRFDEAFAQYQKAIEADPRNGDACNNAAAILLMAGRAHEAEAYLEKAVSAGVEDKINLKLKKLVAEALGKPATGILEEEFGPRGAGDVRAARFSVNASQGKPNAAPLFVNTYIVYDGASKDAVIVDPGAADPRLEDFVVKKGLSPRLVLNTHGHEDHRGGNAHYARLYGVGVAASAEDGAFYEEAAESPAAGALPIRVFETPGHTPGGMCFFVGGFLFTGDSLFEDTIGRVGGGSESERQKIRKTMIARLQDMLKSLPGETPLLPGHGRATTTARAREVNAFLAIN